MPFFVVPFEVKVEGTALVEAENAEAAIDLIENGDWDFEEEDYSIWERKVTGDPEYAGND